MAAHVLGPTRLGLKVLDPDSPITSSAARCGAASATGPDVVFWYTPTVRERRDPWNSLPAARGNPGRAANIFDRLFNGKVASARRGRVLDHRDGASKH